MPARQMISFRKNNQTILHVKELALVSFVRIVVAVHLNTDWVGPIPAVKDVLKIPVAS